MILVTEKNLNKFAYPVFSAKGRNITTPYSIEESTGKFICQEGFMKPSNWIMMDILGTYIYHVAYRHPQDPIDCNKKKYNAKDSEAYYTSRYGMNEDVLDALIRRSQDYKTGIIDDAEYKEITEDYYHDRDIPPRKIITLNLTDGDLKKHFPFLKEYSSLDILNMIESTADCKVGMMYPVRFLDMESTHSKQYSNYDCPCSFFTLTDITGTKMSKDRHVLERRYALRFNTYLGYFFIQNIVSCYTDWIPDNFYRLSDTAQLYYRRCVIQYFNGVKETLNIEEIKSRLQLKTEGHSLRKVIRRCLSELEAATYVKDTREQYLYGHYCYTARKTPWQELKRD